MKKVLAIFLSAVFAISLCACNKNEGEIIGVKGSDSITDSSKDASQKNKELGASNDDPKEIERQKAKKAFKLFDADVTDNELIEEITQSVGNLVFSNSFTLNAELTQKDLINEEEESYSVDAFVEYDTVDRFVKLIATVNEDKYAVYMDKDFVMYATFEPDDNEWDFSTSDESSDLDTVLDIIEKATSTTDENTLFENSDFVDFLSEVTGGILSVDKQKLPKTVAAVIDELTSEDNREMYLGFSKLENTDGITYRIEPDISSCITAVCELSEPAFTDTDSYDTFVSMMTLYDISLTNATLDASLKVDTENTPKSFTVDYEVSGSKEFHLNAQLSDIGKTTFYFDDDVSNYIKENKK